MYVVFDTETTGLPPKKANWETDYKLFPFIMQLSWKRSDEKEVKDFIIKPNGYEIPKEASDLHGITTEIAENEGVYLDEIIIEFIDDCRQAKNIIGHNIYFDTSSLKANTIKLINKNDLSGGWLNDINEALDKSKRIDTMMKTIKFCGLPKPHGNGLKFPKLQELHVKLFGHEFDAHNSKNDVMATEKCYLKLVKLRIINL